MPFYRVALPAAVYERRGAPRSRRRARVQRRRGRRAVCVAAACRRDREKRPTRSRCRCFRSTSIATGATMSRLVAPRRPRTAGTAIDVQADDERRRHRRNGASPATCSTLARSTEALTALVFALPASVTARRCTCASMRATISRRGVPSSPMRRWSTSNTPGGGSCATASRFRQRRPNTCGCHGRPGQPVIGFRGRGRRIRRRGSSRPRGSGATWRARRSQDREGDFAFDLGGTFPVDRIDVDLAELNSVVPAQILARATAGGARGRRVASTVFYRLRSPTAKSPARHSRSSAGAHRYWLLRIDARSGRRRARRRRLRAGWQPTEIVFAARGTAPFVLAYGSRTASPGALPIATLVPGYDAAKGLPANVGAARPDAAVALGGPDRLREPIDVKRWLLWASLVARCARPGVDGVAPFAGDGRRAVADATPEQAPD